jgi:antitoxin component YwqK of YwqJK toxin-antitoxin module
MKIIQVLFVGVFVLLLSCKKQDIRYTYYPDGTLKQMAEYKNGLRNGLTKNYDDRGRLVSTAELKDDVYNGWMTNYNPNNNKVTAKAMFVNDKQNGPVTLYYTSGQLYRESFYKNGLVDSLVKTYWPSGKLKAELYFKMGNPAIGLKEYDKQGNLIKEPSIVILEDNQLDLRDIINLKIYLSDRNKEVDFYEGELVDGKYFNPEYGRLAATDGVVIQQYYVKRRSTLNEKINIMAKCKTELGNTLVLFKTYYLKATN